MVESLPANAGDTSSGLELWSDPWSERIPHAEEQLSPCITSMEPVLEAAMEPGSCSF